MKITFIGTGTMGYPMAKKLLGAGYDLTVYNRTIAKASPLAYSGAKIAQNPANAIKESDYIILMLKGFSVINSILFSDPAILTRKTIIQMGTITPEESMEINKKIISLGGDYVEAPVLGTLNEARAGTLFVIAGGTPEQFSKCEKILANFGPNPLLVGPVGHAAFIKLTLNHLVATLTSAYSQSVSKIQQKGINPNMYMEILKRVHILPG